MNCEKCEAVKKVLAEYDAYDITAEQAINKITDILEPKE